MSIFSNRKTASLMITAALVALPYYLFAQEANHVLAGLERVKIIMLTFLVIPIINGLLIYCNVTLKKNAFNIFTIAASIGFIILAIVVSKGISVYAIPTLIVGLIGVVSGLKNFNRKSEA